MKTNRSIVPIIIDGSAKLLAKGDFCFKTLRKTKVNVTILQPLYPKDFHGEAEMIRFSHKPMQYIIE